MSFFYDNGDILFKIVPILIACVFLLVFIVIIVSAIKGIATWNKNNHAPVIDVQAAMVTKRMEVTGHSSTQNNMSSSHTEYYATFQIESGDRMEFKISGNEYGMLVEGDQGKLTFQGTRYLGFQR